MGDALALGVKMRRWLKVAIVGLVALDYLTPAGPLPLFLADGEARGSSIPLITTPTEPPTLMAPLNTLINQINGILSPLTGGAQINGAQPNTGAVATNIIALVPGVSGSPAQLTLQPGGDPSASIQIVPDLPGGDIILFSTQSTGGNLVFANASMWVPATGLAACPGVNPGQGTNGSLITSFGPASTIQGYWVIEDWLARQHFAPSC